MSSYPQLPPTESPPSLGVHPYSSACVMFFTIVGIILQVPVIYTHCGAFSRPNIPVIAMSLCYMYLMVSFTVAAEYWHSPDVSTWWTGKGWCDLDVRLYMAISLCVLSSQCVINWNIVELLGDRPRLIVGNRAWIHGAIELACCLFLPIVSLATSTFFMERRYEIIQDLGCTAVSDTSIALIVTYLMWIPILGAGALVTMFLIGLRFWKRGRVQAMETVSFIPHMSPSQFIRIIIFSAAVTCIFVPLTFSVAVINFINIDDYGVHAIAWAHGKPAGWDKIGAASLEQVAIVLTKTEERASIIVSFIIRYINIVIAWLLFLCYATGSLARQAYKVAIYKLIGHPEEPEDASETIDDYSIPPSSPQEWDMKFSGAHALKEWEAGLRSKIGTQATSTYLSSPTTPTSEHASEVRAEMPQSSLARKGPSFPMRDFLSGNFLGRHKD